MTIEDRFKSLAHKVFFHTYTVYFMPSQILFLRKPVEVVAENTYQLLNVEDNWGCTLTEVDHDLTGYLKELMLGTPATNTIPELDKLTTDRVQEYNMTANDFVELINADFEVDFKYPKDVVFIHELLTDYLATITERQLFSLNFKGVPTDDVKKMRIAADCIAELAGKIQDGQITDDVLWKSVSVVSIKALQGIQDPNAKRLEEFKTRKHGTAVAKQKEEEWNPYDFR